MHGPSGDLTCPSVVRQLCQDIRAGKVLAVMFAPPCTSFSVARDRTKVIRTREQPWGIDPCFLTEAEQKLIIIGNQCFKTVFKLIRLLNRERIPCILENPHLPFLQKLLESPQCVYAVTDFCQFDTPWRKRTLFLTGNLDAEDISRLQRRCEGHICSRSHRKHFQLSGSNAKGIPWTRIAQPYPHKLCKQLAFCLTCPTHY